MIDLFLTSESQKREKQARKIINERLHSMVQSRKCKESTMYLRHTILSLHFVTEPIKKHRRHYLVSYNIVTTKTVKVVVMP